MVIRITPLIGINDLKFGDLDTTLLATLGSPTEVLENYTGEVEMLFGDCFYRFFERRFVECTFPARHQFVVANVPVLSIFEWLGSLTGTLDKAKFLINTGVGIAYDYRNPDAGSITVFEAGRWDQILSST